VALKRRLLTERLPYYYQMLSGYEAAQWEVLEAVLQSLTHVYPDHFTLRQEKNHWHWQNRLLGEETSFMPGNSGSLPLEPLDWAGRQVQEDLVLLAGPESSLIGGQLCFANGWCLDDKLGLPFLDIHTPVIPTVEPMIRAAQKLMERLPVGRPVWRANWSVKVTDQLDMTSRHTPALDQLLADRLPTMTPNTIGHQLYLRIERQTLTRLPQSGAVLFGIHTYQNRLADEVAARPDAARRLAQVFRTTPAALLDYKGMTPFMPPLLAYLSHQC
jgi:hypothetical protein